MAGLAVCVHDARAGTLDTPRCRADIDEAKRLILSVAARKNGPAERTRAEVCRYFQLDLQDLATARDLAAPCMTEPTRSQELRGLRESIEITQRRLNSQCRIQR